VAAAGLDLFGFAFEPAMTARGHAGMAFRLRLAATVTQAMLLFLLLPLFGTIGGAWATFGGSLAAVLLTGSAAFRRAPAVSGHLAAEGPPR
jgi:O-antigen/teichoic acid export membrane protein